MALLLGTCLAALIIKLPENILTTANKQLFIVDKEGFRKVRIQSNVAEEETELSATGVKVGLQLDEAVSKHATFYLPQLTN